MAGDEERLARRGGVVKVRAEDLVAGMGDDPEPSRDALLALEGATRLGYDANAPWAGWGGDGGQSWRSPVDGPLGGLKVEPRCPLPVHGLPSQLAVASEGRDLLVAGCGPVRGRRRRGVRMGMPGVLQVNLADPARIEWRPWRGIGSNFPVLQPGRQVVRDEGRLFRGFRVTDCDCDDSIQRRAVAVGLEHEVAVVAPEGTLEVTRLGQERPRWRSRDGVAISAVLTPGVQIAVLVLDSYDHTLRIDWRDLTTGSVVATCSLGEARVDLPFGHPLVAGQDGTVFTTLGRDLVGCGPGSRRGWRAVGSGGRIALGGDAAHVVVTHGFDGRSEFFAGHQAADGRRMWRTSERRRRPVWTPDPKVGGSGLLYWGRQDHLVVMDPMDGRTVDQVLVTDIPEWDFAFAGSGLVYVLAAPNGLSQPLELLVVRGR